MFTGIITDIGRVQNVTTTSKGEGEGRRFEIETVFEMDRVSIGASIACSGACMTVVEKSDHTFTIEVSAESLSKTTLGSWQSGTRVNLERAMCLGDELGGHMVSGHVDGIGTLTDRTQDGDSQRLIFAVSPDLKKFIAAKGSVTVDGISLTINEVNYGKAQTTFGINVIPHTQMETTLGALPVDGHVNVEIDMLARYVANLLAHK